MTLTRTLQNWRKQREMKAMTWPLEAMFPLYFVPDAAAGVAEDLFSADLLSLPARAVQ